VGESASELAFPITQRSVVLGVRSIDPEERSRAFDAIVAVYWRPVHRCLRARWGTSEQDAEDLAQGFFADALEKGLFARFDPARGRFRTYLLTCLDGYAANERRASLRLKRGGGATVVPLERRDGSALAETAEGPGLEAHFEREWARSLFSLAVEALHQRCRGTRHETAFHLFEAYDLESADPASRRDYASLAAEHGIPLTQVTNLLAWARREFRTIVLAKLRELTASEEEFRSEARALLGLDRP
jgi:hypothetical protein